MSAPEWYSWYVRAWRESPRARAMNWAQRGVYRELIDEQFLTGPLPEDPRVVAKMIGAPVAIVTGVLDIAFPVCDDGLRRNNRATVEVAITAARTARVTDQRRGAARARWAKRQTEPDATRMRPACELDAQGQGHVVPSELPRGTPRARPVRQKHAWYRDARFKALTELWPESRRGNKSAAFACWEGQGEDGKARIEAKVRQTVTDCPDFKLGAFSELVLDVAHAPYAPSVAAKTEPCDYCGVKFSTDNGILTLHARACAAALKAKAMVRP